MSDIIWKTLQYNGETYNKFEVSSDGQLRNVKTGTVYKQHLNKEGYNQVCVSLGSRNKKKVFKIHKAVAETFIPNPENKETVNHINGNKQKNTVDNLEWATYSENTQHAERMGLTSHAKGADSTSSKLSNEDIIYIRENYILNSYEFGTRGLSRKFNVHHETIRDIIHNNTYTNV